VRGGANKGGRGRMEGTTEASGRRAKARWKGREERYGDMLKVDGESGRGG